VDFTNIYAQGFARVAARVLPIHLADPAANAAAIAADLAPLSQQGCALVVYPELCLTGATCGDLFRQDALLDAVEQALDTLRQASFQLLPMILVGAPLRCGNRLYNCAVAIHRGQFVAVVPQTHPAADGAGRWFSAAPFAGDPDPAFSSVPIAGRMVEVSVTCPLECETLPLRVAVTVGTDGWTPQPMHVPGVLDGAEVIAHLASPAAVLGGADERRTLVQAASLRARAAYVLACAGAGESSTGAVFDGLTLIAECGDVLDASPRFPVAASGVTADIDLRRVRQERVRAGMTQATKTDWNMGCECSFKKEQTEPIAELPSGDLGLLRRVRRFPFAADDPAELARDCQEALAIQTAALVRRIQAIGGNVKPVLGVSGGLDSTIALIVCVRAMEQLGRPRTDVLAFTMPGFATSTTTTSNAMTLMQALGVSAETIDIRAAGKQILADLGHPYADGKPVYDVTFENVQAGLRADYLFRVANQRGGFVIGTGDLSEESLGWCTYGVGDHISHYGVNAGVPKTLLQFMVGEVIRTNEFGDVASDVLAQIVAQEISPELIPQADGQALQSSEGSVGPFPLNDFFVYHTLRWGASPSRIAFLAWHAWHDQQAGSWPPGYPDDRKTTYDLATIKSWLGKFYQRFFINQYKRSCAADGPSVCPTGSFDPRGGWAMPSDATATAWLDALNRDVPDKL